MNARYDKLVSLLKELFQLDQPELDFGIYRIMRVKSDEITQFLENDLLPQVKEAFASYQSADKAVLEKELREAIEQARGLGVDPEATQKVQELRRRLQSEAVDTAALEADVYDHLYRFFRRYYQDGDFISRRVYKDGVYAIPYEGEEVKLYWANHDQYYIKTSEYLRDYAFRLRPENETNPMRVHFRLVDAAEGEHNNVKESKNRLFVLAGDDFIGLEAGATGEELVIRFEYRPATLDDWPEDQRKGKKSPPTQADLLAIAERRILAVDDDALMPWLRELAMPYTKADGEQADYSRLQAHLRGYTKRNTFDYFIHKDLRGFLRRELDFYIKNEVMRLDDIESESAPRVEQYLSKIKVIRKIAHKIIDFLAQLEDFQKKLWLKKKFVTETTWCIRVGIIPEEFYPEICQNDAQREEWVHLHAIDELEGTGGNLLEPGKPGYSDPLTPEFLRAHPTLMIDTRHFDEDFTARLLEALNDLDEQTDGVLVHSENFQALNLMQARFKEEIKCVYIDPPYNTERDRSTGKFVYKDGYVLASWAAMMYGRLLLTKSLLRKTAGTYVSIDDTAYADLYHVFASVFGRENHIATIIWEKVHTRKNSAKHFSVSHDYIPCFARDKNDWERLLIPRENTDAYSNPDNDPRGPWKPDPVYANNPYEADYTIKKPNGVVLSRPPGQYWRFSQTRWEELVRAGAVIWGEGDSYPMVKRYLRDVQDGLVPVTLFKREFAGDNSAANAEFDDLFGSERLFSYPKPSRLIERLCQLSLRNDVVELALDFFAGSGTTGHAVINLNREDGGQRKFILVEMADYFDTVLVPRLKKVTFTPEWKSGKPKRLPTEEEAERSPRIFKIVRLESYEDTLNNLEFKRSQAQADLLSRADVQGPDSFREQYMLHYMLDVETRGSQSLLNIADFVEPTQYRLNVKIPGSDESREVCVDLLETFNWLIGLQVHSIRAPQRFTAAFKRAEDPDLPKDAPRRLLLDGSLKDDPNGPWWLRAVEGETRDGRKTLVIWRNRPGGEDPGGVEQDNLVLEAWFRQHLLTKDSEYDLIYVNGTNNLENLKAPDDTWKVRLIEEDFHRLMFATEDV